MAYVQFPQEKYTQHSRDIERSQGLTELVIKWRLAKDAAQAQAVLLVFAVIMIIATVAIYLTITPSKQTIPDSEINKYIEEMNKTSIR